MRNVHGGCYMTFADYCLFAFAAHELQGPAVTVSFACEFLDAAKEGELIVATGGITRAGGSLIRRVAAEAASMHARNSRTPGAPVTADMIAGPGQ